MEEMLKQVFENDKNRIQVVHHQIKGSAGLARV